MPLAPGEHPSGYRLLFCEGVPVPVDFAHAVSGIITMKPQEQEFPMAARLITPLVLLIALLLTGCGRDDPQAALEAAVQQLQDSLEAKKTAAVLDQLHPQFGAQQQSLDRDWAKRSMVLLFLRHKNVQVLALSKSSRVDPTYPDNGHTQAQLALTRAKGNWRAWTGNDPGCRLARLHRPAGTLPAPPAATGCHGPNAPAQPAAAPGPSPVAGPHVEPRCAADQRPQRLGAPGQHRHRRLALPAVRSRGPAVRRPWCPVWRRDRLGDGPGRQRQPRPLAPRAGPAQRRAAGLRHPGGPEPGRCELRLRHQRPGPLVAGRQTAVGAGLCLSCQASVTAIPKPASR